MDKLIDYVCDELEKLEKKADKGNLSMTEIQYADMLAHLKKNILTADAMMESDDGYSGDYSYARGDGRGRGRNARRDSRGRYSNDYRMSDGMGGTYNRGGSYSREGGYSRDDAKDDMLAQLHDMEHDADDETRQMIRKWIKQVEDH